MPKTETKKRRKKRRRYRLVIPWLEEARKNSEAQSPVKKRRKKTRFKLRNVRKEVWFVLAGIVVLLGVLLIPGAIEKSKLKKLGYNKETITAIRRQKLAKTLIDNQYYSEYLASCIRSGTVNTDYLSLYTVIEGEKYLDDTDFLMVGRLRDKGYVEEQILNLYKNLRFVDITPLLIYDYQVLEQGYIDDCLAHPDNSRSSFVLTHNFYTPYENTYSADPNRTDMLVNKTWHLDETYEPKELTPLSVHCGASGTQLSKEAADAMEEWAAGGKAVGVSFYATSSYRSYDSQKALYDNYVFLHGQDQADRESARPGFSEHQTGLTVDVAAVGDEDKDFSETSAFIWASANCMDYGWILRYPENKEDITGYEYESWHYRYVGKDLAQAVYKSGMTYDEFWSLYLKPWSDETNKPSDAVLANSDWHNLLKSEEAPAEGETASQESTEEAQAQ